MNKINGLMHNKTFLVILSLLSAVIIWFTVVTVVSDEGMHTIQGVPVNINVQAGVLGQMGLNPIEGGETTVEAVVFGSRRVIGGVSVEDITVTASLAGVSGAGTYELSLVANNSSDKDFEILSISPASMTVKFDRFVDKTFYPEYELTGDYSIPDGYLLESISTSPAEIVVSGPEKDVANISKIIAFAEFSGILEQTTSSEAVLHFLDKNNEEININPEQIKLSEDNTKVIMSLLRTKPLNARFEYMNVPKSFPVEQLKSKMSIDSIYVAGPTNVVGNYEDLLTGYIDISEITPENKSFSFDVNLPESFINTENVEYVQVDFDLEGYVERDYYVRNIVVMNVPVSYDLNVLSQQITVKMVGPEEVLDNLTAGDIVAEIDISDRTIKTGQYMTPVKISVPNGALAWAVGDYNTAVIVRERR